MTDSDACIVLNMLPGMGPVKARRLADAFGSPAQILTASIHALSQVQGIGQELAQSIHRWSERVDPAQERQAAADCDAVIVTQSDEAYPDWVRTIHDPPLVLYVRGAIIPRDRRAVAVVGTRSPSSYGRDSAQKLSYQMAYAGITVVSGLARGVDTEAHKAALAAKGRTIGVLGCGIDQVYPSENTALAERIVASGAIVSEFPVGTKPDRQTFPIRNRIASALSLGVLVVEAPRNSGSLITARMALDQGRQVFAIPGRIDNPTSAGCHELLKQGARLVEDASDVCAELALAAPDLPTTETSDPSAHIEMEVGERLIWDVLGTEEMHVDAIIRKSGLPAAEVSATLFSLEMKRLVTALPGKLFSRIQS